MSRLARGARVFALLACAAIVLGGAAHAGHIHKQTPHDGHDHIACQLCLQFDRAASAPPEAVVVVSSTLATRVSPSSHSSGHIAPFPRRYHARGPPLP